MHDSALLSPTVLRLVLCIFVLSIAEAADAADGQWGSVRGVIRLNKGISKLPPLVKKGDESVKDAAICAASDLPNESVVVDSQSNGLANVVLYLVNRPPVIHPDLVHSQREPVDFKIKGCRFVPHILVVRTGQEIHISSNDQIGQIGHNVHPYAMKNRIGGEILASKSVVTLREPERVPLKLGCDIHPWMNAYWVVLDHPYVAVTNEKGEFEIPNLPVGDQVFRIWHEEVGFLDKAYAVVVKSGVNKIDPITFSADKFEQ